LSQQAIVAGSFDSVRQLVDAIIQYLAQHNLNPKRCVWRAKGEENFGQDPTSLESDPWVR